MPSSLTLDMVVTAGDTPDRDYLIRRVAADTSTPLVLHTSLAMELAEAFKRGQDACGPL